MELDVSRIHPRHQLVLVKRYRKPEQVRGIYIPESHAADPTQSLWEVITAGPRVADVLGTTLARDAIVFTRPKRGHFIDDEHAFLDAREILKVITWSEDDEDETQDCFT